MTKPKAKNGTIEFTFTDQKPLPFEVATEGKDTLRIKGSGDRFRYITEDIPEGDYTLTLHTSTRVEPYVWHIEIKNGRDYARGIGKDKMIVERCLVLTTSCDCYLPLFEEDIATMDTALHSLKPIAQKFREHLSTTYEF